MHLQSCSLCKIIIIPFVKSDCLSQTIIESPSYSLYPKLSISIQSFVTYSRNSIAELHLSLYSNTSLKH